MDSKVILSKNKARTTHENLVKGIEEAVSGLDLKLLLSVCMVALSSTLATNAIVEGRYGRVALVSIGKVYEGSAAADHVLNISGGHGIHGGEENPLDTESAEKFVRSMRGRVDAFAISSVMSIRNPEHETAIREMVEKELGIPAICGHELSSTLGFNVRSATCVMNAGLIPVMRDLLDAVRRMMIARRIIGPLMIVRGNGSLMNDTTAMRYPVETIMSGPTASMIGAISMTGLKDAIVMDVGGTTTDIGILHGGLPAVVPEGISVGNVRTHISAARLCTAAFGGDSRVYVNGSRIRISKIRAIPLCVAAEMWEDVGRHLDNVRRSGAMAQRVIRAECMVNLDCEMFVCVRAYDGRIFVTNRERRFMEMTRDRPMSRTEAAIALRCNPSELDVDPLEQYGYLRRISVTPTDVVAAIGLYDHPRRDMSEIGVDHLAACSGRDRDTFFRDVRSAILMRIGRELLTSVMTDEYGVENLPRPVEMMLANALGISSKNVLDSRITFRSPIVGIGASAGIYIRWLGGALGTSTVIPEDSDVGNAVGAISAPMSESLQAIIIPSILGSKNEQYEIYIKAVRTEVQGIARAKDRALVMAEEAVREALELAGATDIEFSHDSQESYIEVPDGSILSEVRITVRGVGRPAPFSKQERKAAVSMIGEMRETAGSEMNIR